MGKVLQCGQAPALLLPRPPGQSAQWNLVAENCCLLHGTWLVPRPSKDGRQQPLSRDSAKRETFHLPSSSCSSLPRRPGGGLLCSSRRSVSPLPDNVTGSWKASTLSATALSVWLGSSFAIAVAKSFV